MLLVCKAKRDARKIDMVIRRFYDGWEAEITTLARFSPDGKTYTVGVFGAGEQKEAGALKKYEGPTFGIAVVSESSVRKEKVRRILEQYNLEVLEFEEGSTPTAEMAARRIGVPVARIAKSILMKGKDGRFFMFVVEGDVSHLLEYIVLPHRQHMLKKKQSY
jgi:hypothetical protein